MKLPVDALSMVLVSAPMRRSVYGLMTCVIFNSAATACGVVALGLQVFELTEREFDLGLLGLAEFLPAALLVFITGPVADRHDRRRVVAVAALGEAVAAVGLALYSASSPTAVLPIFGIVIVFGIFRAFLAPAERAIPSDIVPPEQLPKLVTRFSIAWQISLVAGPVLGGFLYAANPTYPYVAMALFLVLGAIAIMAVEKPQRITHHDELTGTSLNAAFAGFRFIRTRPILLGAISLDLFAVLFGGAVALLPAIAHDRLGVGPVGLGWLRASIGIGAGLTTLVLAIRPKVTDIGRTLLLAVGVFGIFTVVLGATTNYAVAFIALLVLSGADSISVYIRSTLVPLLTPPGLRGRVLAVENVFIGASNELGAFESGIAGAAFGAPAAIVLGGVATILIAVSWWFGFPALRRLDGFNDETEFSEELV